jgi:hypothetical protein
LTKQPELKDALGRTFYGRAEQTSGGVWFYSPDGIKCIPLMLKTIPAQGPET